MKITSSLKLILVLLGAVLFSGCGNGPSFAPLANELTNQVIYTAKPEFKISQEPVILWNGNTREYLIYFILEELNTDRQLDLTIGILSSKNGTTWEYRGICRGDSFLGRSKKSKVNLSNPFVAFKDGLCHMYLDKNYLTTETGNEILYFTSYDGLYWNIRPAVLSKDVFDSPEMSGGAYTIFYNSKYTVSVKDKREIVVSLGENL